MQALHQLIEFSAFTTRFGLTCGLAAKLWPSKSASLRPLQIDCPLDVQLTGKWCSLLGTGQTFERRRSRPSLPTVRWELGNLAPVVLPTELGFYTVALQL
jgi:hypothetical protein